MYLTGLQCQCCPRVQTGTSRLYSTSITGRAARLAEPYMYLTHPLTPTNEPWISSFRRVDTSPSIYHLLPSHVLPRLSPARTSTCISIWMYLPLVIRRYPPMLGQARRGGRGPSTLGFYPFTCKSTRTTFQISSTSKMCEHHEGSLGSSVSIVNPFALRYS